MARRNVDMLVRAMELVRALNTRRKGLRIAQLAEETGLSRASVYRYLRRLEDAGIPLVQEAVNGEARYRLDFDLPGTRPTSEQLVSLAVVREMLTAMDGTRMVRELDAFLSAARGGRAVEAPVSARALKHPAGSSGSATALVERAILEKRVLRMLYKKKDAAEPEWRDVEPVALRLWSGQLYFDAWDPMRNAWRRFKPMRVKQAEVLETRAGHRTADAAHLADSVTVWVGEPVDVVVRLNAEGAEYVSEWPLHDAQTVVPLPDGGALVRARMPGLWETVHWVLNWGHKAQVMEPAALRTLVLEELQGALANYGETDDRD